MHKPLDEKALEAAAKLYAQGGAMGLSQDEVLEVTQSIIEEYLEATQAGESEAVAWQHRGPLGGWITTDKERDYSERSLYIAPPSLAAVQAKNERLREALARQTDNLAFLLNRVELPDEWFTKFEKELVEDRAALAVQEKVSG